jgi:uncharacterized membrane protein
MKNRNLYKKILLAYLFLVMAVFTLGFFFQPNATELIYTPGFLSLAVAVLFVFAALHAVERYKWYGLLFVALGVAIPSLSEWNSMVNGMPFGFPYAYSGLIGTALFGFPIGAMLSWFLLIYCSFTITNFIFVNRTVWLAVFDALIMTSMDLVVDPVMTRMGAWEWSGMGEYFGIPIGNYVGWFVVSLIVCVIFRWLISRKNKKLARDGNVRLGSRLEKIWLVSPVVVYIFFFFELTMLVSILGMWDVVMIGLLSSQMVAAIALVRFYEKY